MHIETGTLTTKEEPDSSISTETKDKREEQGEAEAAGKKKVSVGSQQTPGSNCSLSTCDVVS